MAHLLTTAERVVVLPPDVTPPADAVMSIVKARKVGMSYDWASLSSPVIVHMDREENKRLTNSVMQQMSAEQILIGDAAITLAPDSAPYEYVIHSVTVPAESPVDEQPLTAASRDQWRRVYRRAFVRADEIGCKTMVCGFPTANLCGAFYTSDMLRTALTEAFHFFEHQRPQYLQKISFDTNNETHRRAAEHLKPLALAIAKKEGPLTDFVNAQTVASAADEISSLISGGKGVSHDEKHALISRIGQLFERLQLEKSRTTTADSKSSSAKASEGDRGSSASTSSDEKCLICCTEKRNCLFEPCRHVCVCSDCADKLKAVALKGGATQFPCPICRVSVQRATRVFV